MNWKTHWKMSPFLKKWAPWLFTVFLLAVYVNAAPSVSGVGCTNCVLRTGDTMSGTLISSVGSGSNAIALSVNGARVDLGTGGSDFWASDGTNIITPTSVLPTVANSPDLGSTTFYWGNVWAGAFQAKVASGNNAFSTLVNGARIDFGAGANDYASSDGTTVTFAGPLVVTGTLITTSTIRPGTQYLNNNGQTVLYSGQVNSGGTDFNGNVSDTAGNTAINLYNAISMTSADDRYVTQWYRDALGNSVAKMATSGVLESSTPMHVASVYVNNTIAAFTYGGGKLPAHANTITNVSYNIRTIGSGGTTNNTFQISDGTNTCNCTFACNQATGSQIASCANGAGTGCVYAASAALTFGFSAVGDCTVPTDILGNMDVLGKWQ